MAKKIEDVMSRNVVALGSNATVLEAAQVMNDRNIGSVVVLEKGGDVRGIVTDRDLTVRALARGLDPRSTALSKLCSGDVIELKPTDDIGDAVSLMRSKAVRRIPVVDGGELVGIVSLGDLAMVRDERSALGAISSAPPNR